MTPDRLRGWLKHKPAGSTTLQLCVDSLSGIVVLADWNRDELDSSEVPEIEVVDGIISAAQEYTDAEGDRSKFLIRWMSNRDKPLKVVTHHAVPTESDEEGAPTDSNRQLVDQLLQGNREQQKALLDMAKQVTAAAHTMQAAYDRTIAMQAAHAESLHKLLQEQRAAAPAPVVAEVTPESREESIQRAKALEALTGKIPEVMDLALAAVANKFLPAVGGEDGGPLQ